MGRSIIVTGGAGFIGANFVHHLLATDAETQVITLDALTYAGNLENLRDLPDPARHTFIEGNIGDSALVTEVLREQLQAGKLTPVVAKAFPLAEASEALHYLMTGEAPGRIVLIP